MEGRIVRRRISVGESWDEIAISSVLQNKQEADMTYPLPMKLNRDTETKIVKEDAKTNVKSEVEVINLEEDEKSEVETKEDAKANEKSEVERKKLKRDTETKIVKKDAKTNVKSEVEVINLEEDEKSKVEIINLEEETLADVYGLEIKSEFARLHISRGNRRHIRVLLAKHRSIGGFLAYNSYYKDPVQRIDFPAPFTGGTKLLGSADGLTFLFDGSVPACAIFNPSTKKCLHVQLSPPPPNYYCPIVHWFGDIDGTGNYILVLGVAYPTELWVYKFSLGSNILKRIRSTRLPNWFFLEGRGTLVQGVLHWPLGAYDNGFDHNKILTYDFGKNKIEEISCPDDVCVRLGLFVDGCSLMATSSTSIWIMKDGRWTKFADVEVSCDLDLLDPLGFFSIGDLIMEVSLSKLMRYNFTRKEATLLYEYGRNGNGERIDGAIVCADTLLSPG